MSLTNFQLNLHTFCTLYFKYKIESTVIKFLMLNISMHVSRKMVTKYVRFDKNKII